MSKVKIHIDKSAPAEAAFCKQFGLTPLHWQTKGVAFDAEDSQGFRYEFKNDLMGSKTGNHYLETHQTNDGGETWVHSGFSLALLQAKYYVVRVSEEYIVTLTEELDLFLNYNHKKVKETQTRPGTNGNRSGQFSKGLLIRIDDLKTVPGTRVVTCK